MLDPERWKQRFQNYQKAFKKLENAIYEYKNHPDNEVIQAGLIQTFEFTFELGWKTLKDYLEIQGLFFTTPRETIKQALQSKLIEDGYIWLEALDSRNEVAHHYDEATSAKVANDIQNNYFEILKTLLDKLGSIATS